MKFFETQYPDIESNLSLANFFNVYEEKGELYYAINKTVYFDSVPKIGESSPYFSDYRVNSKDTWPLIAYRHYGTIKLWWLVCKVNGIIDATKNPEPDTFIKILDKSQVLSITKSLRTD